MIGLRRIGDSWPMKIIRIVSGVFAVFGIALGFVMGGTRQEVLGNTLILAGAIVIAGLLISLAITEKKGN